MPLPTLTIRAGAWTGIAACAWLVSSLALGCSAEADAPEDRGSDQEPAAAENPGVTHEVAPMHTVELDDSLNVYFWEYEPGEISVAVSAPIGVTVPEFDENARVVDILEQLQPGEPIPAVIAEAQVRQDQYLSAEVEVESPADDAGEAAVSVTLDDQEADSIPKYYSADGFVDEFCLPSTGRTIGSYNGWVSTCAPNRTGGGTWITSKYKAIRAIVAADDGNVTHQLSRRPHGSSSWTVLNNTTVYEGHFYWNSSRSTAYRDYRFRISNASGDVYHRATHHYTDDCGEQRCCRFSYPDLRSCPVSL